MALELDHLLLGLVGVLDAVRRYVHRPHQPWPDDPSVRDRCAARAEPGEPRLVRDLGGAAIDVQRRTGELVGKGGVVNTDAALFQLLDQYPLASASSVLTIVAALPFVLVMSALCLSLYLDLKTDPMILRGQIGIELVEEAVVQGVQTHGDEFGLVLESADTDTVSDEFDKDHIPVRTGRE